MTRFLFFVIPIMVQASAYAQESAPTPEVETYRYGMHLDIAEVVELSPTPDICGLTPVQITYNDSKGVTHIVGIQSFRQWLPALTLAKQHAIKNIDLGNRSLKVF